MFEGCCVALVTPFTSKGCVDEEALKNLVAWQVTQGVHSVLAVGTTGEAATMSIAERLRVVELCVEAAGKTPVIAGSGTNSTRKTIELTCAVQSAGAAAALIVVPYYNKPAQQGLYEHFRTVHDATDLPILIYNIPGRSAVDMSLEVVARLAKLPRIVGIKDATADLSRPLYTRLMVGSEFSQLSGEDATVTAFLAQGGHGCISVTANVAAKLCVRLYDAWECGQYDEACALRDRLAPLHRAMFCENSPAPAKYGLSLLAKCTPLVRAPLAAMTAVGQAQVRAAMAEAGLLDA